MATFTTGSEPTLDLDASDDVSIFSPWPESTGSDSPPNRLPRTLAPNLTRRAHKKSRGGCYSCKSRKIKCQETRPACENCTIKELDCRYPSPGDQKIIRRPTGASGPKSQAAVVGRDEPRLGPSPSPPTSFSMGDMQCFHHFLTVAFPHLPLGNDSVWVQDIPVFAQQHTYLMHALLALGASHLTRVSPPTDYNTAAIVHRGQAIKGLNEALAKGSRDYGELDAMLATCYALTFQASCMGDGMTDFITMVRGCALITAQIHKDNSATAFNVGKDNHLRIIGPRLDQLPVLDHSLLNSAILSVQALSPLLQSMADQELQTAMLSVLFALQQSSKAGYLNFIRIYDIFIGMGHDQFNAFVDLNNIPSQLLMAHFVSLQMLMIPLTLHEWPERINPAKAKVLLGMVEWGDNIFLRTPASVSPYLEWPRAIMQTVRREVDALDAGTSQSLRLRILDPSTSF